VRGCGGEQLAGAMSQERDTILGDLYEIVMSPSVL
jgi:hypothetical protein